MDFHLSQLQRDLQRRAREFARSWVRVRAADLDREPEPEAAYAADLIHAADAAGLRLITLPPEHGGYDADSLTEVLVLEEIATADAGFATALAHAWREGKILARLATDRARDELLGPLVADSGGTTSLAMTEEHAGSDIMLPFAATLESGPQTSARLIGDVWRIDGRKRWITNGRDSSLIVLVARTGPDEPWTDGITVFLVPRATPGVRGGAVEDKLGLRANQNAEIVFDGVEVPDHYRVGDVGGGAVILRAMGAASKAKEGAKALGIAQAAHDEAVAWAGNRVQGGQPVLEQAVHAELAELGAQIEAARGLVWRAAWAADHEDADIANRLSDQVRLVTARVAVDVSRAALEVHGAYGVQRGRPVEKLARDALTMLHASGGLHAYRARLGGQLAAARRDAG